MRIVNKDEFMKLPDGTIYSLYKPCFFTGLFRKGENCNAEDYYEMSLIGNVKCESSVDMAEILLAKEADSTSFELEFDCEGRNGMFESEQLYAIYESKDISGLIKTLEG